MRPRSKTTERRSIKIPKPLYDRIDEVTVGSHFTSVTDFITFVLRDLLAQSERTKRTPGGVEIEETRRRLRNLGYL
jgi:Arc/MetJ-type ribon-helix-helix transcriptional regulator